MTTGAKCRTQQGVADASELPILIILDMNGVLLKRSKRSSATRRPHLQKLLETLFEDLALIVQVAVWSSMMKHNLDRIVVETFGEYVGKLAFVWDQTRCTKKWVPGMRKPLLRKDLMWVAMSENPWADHMPDRVVLIDDDPIKCTENPEGTALHPSTWAGSGEGKDDIELLRLAAYLKELAATTADNQNRSVRDYIKSHPFADFHVITDECIDDGCLSTSAKDSATAKTNDGLSSAMAASEKSEGWEKQESRKSTD